MAAPVPGKYQLKSLHEEIDLFDRKIAHLLRYEEFSSDGDRNAAARTLANKRELLVRAARQMASDGIEFSDADLPRSFRTPDQAPTSPAPEAPVSADLSEDAQLAPAAKHHPSPFAGTSLDYRKNLQEYKRRKKKA